MRNSSAVAWPAVCTPSAAWRIMVALRVLLGRCAYSEYTITTTMTVTTTAAAAAAAATTTTLSPSCFSCMWL